MQTPGKKELRPTASVVPAIPKIFSWPRPRLAGRAIPVSDATRFWQQPGLLVLTALLSIGSYLIISHFFVQQVEVVGVSMVPTLNDRGHYLLNRWTFRHHNPRVRDVVVLVDPDDQELSVKRVVAVAGDSIHFQDGKVYVNGRELQEPYLASRNQTFTDSPSREQTITCGKDQYFVLGDNRERSVDSRFFGLVPRENIKGLLMIN